MGRGYRGESGEWHRRLAPDAFRTAPTRTNETIRHHAPIGSRARDEWGYVLCSGVGWLRPGLPRSRRRRPPAFSPVDGSTGRRAHTRHAGGGETVFLCRQALGRIFHRPRTGEGISFGWARTTVCDDPICAAAGASRGGSWTLDDRIVFGALEGGLSIVSAAGGDPQSLTAAEEGVGHWYPVVMPDDRAILFTIYPGSYQGARVALYVFSSGEVRELFEGAIPRFASGHILYAREDSLWAVAFDEDALEPEGNPFLVQEDVARPNTTVQFQVAEDGTLVYVPGGFGFSAPAAVWVDREGRQEPIPMSEDSYRSVRLSPDGTRLALQEFQMPSDLWVYDIARGTLNRLTNDPAQDLSPLWTLDGKRVVFGSEREGVSGLFSMNADGTGDVERLMTEDFGTFLSPHAWAPDGTTLLFSGGGSGGRDILFLFVPGEREPEALIRTEFHEDQPAVSADGRWVAYMSRLSGQSEVFVERFPDLGDRRLVSTGGGRIPLWSSDGSELFYMNLDSNKLMVVAIDSEAGLTIGTPEVLFEGDFFSEFGLRTYDVTPDGQRFVMLTRGGAETSEQDAAPALVVVQNWLAEH